MTLIFGAPARRDTRARTRRAAPAVALAIGLLLATLSGCAAKASSTEAGPSDTGPVSRANRGLVENDDAPKLGGKLVYGLQSESNGWNPGTNQWASSGLLVAHAIFDTIATYDDASEVHPYAAERFDHNDDYTQWTILMRNGIKLHNGKAVTADTVSRALNTLKSSPVVGQAFSTVDTISVSGPMTIKVTTHEPFVSFPALLSTQVGVVCDPDWLASNDSKLPIGSGPFVLKTWNIGDRLVAAKNPDYWQKDTRGNAFPYLDSVEFRIIGDTTTRGQALKAGDVDVIQTYSGAQIQDFQKLDGYQVFSDQSSETAERFVMLNTMVPPFDDPDARKALALATDKKAFDEIVGGGFNEVADGPFPKSSPWYAESGYPQFDLAQATELAAKVAARHGGTFEFELNGIGDPVNQQMLEVLQQQWATAGIKANVVLEEPAKRIIKVVTGSYQSALWLQFDEPNPVLETVWWDPAHATTPPAFSLNFARNKDEAIGVALHDAAGARDDASFKAAMTTIQQRFAVDLPYIWLIHQQNAVIASSRVVNLTHYLLPDGAVGLDMIQGAHPVHQIWLA